MPVRRIADAEQRTQELVARRSVSTSGPTEHFLSHFASMEVHHAVRIERSWFRQAFAGLFFLDDMQHKNASVWIVAFHYLPILAMILSITVDCLLHVFLSLVFPLVSSDDESTARSDRSLPMLITLLLAHGGVYVGVCVVGYKCMCGVLDAMIDSCLYVVDPQSKASVSYYSLLHDLSRVVSQWWTLCLFVSTALAVPVCLYSVFVEDALSMSWSINSSPMFMFCTALFVVAGVWVTLSFFVVCRRQRCANSAAQQQNLRSTQVVSSNVLDWWRVMLPRARRRCTYAILAAALFFFMERGGSEGMHSLSEGMMYLVTPHIILVLCCKLTLFVARVAEAVRRLARSPPFRRVFFILISPWCVAMCCSAHLLRSPHIFVMELLPVLLQLITLSKLLPRHAEQKTALWPVAVALYSCNTKHLQRSLPHFRAGRLVRVLVRVMLGASFGIVAALGAWVTLQEGGWFMGQRGTLCARMEEGGDAPDHIRVSTEFMVADLYGLPQDSAIDPNSLVYEADPALYDTNRYSSLCSRWWHGLHAADLAYFSLMSYLDRDALDFHVGFTFYQNHRKKGKSWTVVPPQYPLKRSHVPIVHFRSAEANVSVIAVRGTDLAAPHDFLQNIFVFAETAIFQMLGSIAPLGALLSDRVKADVFAVSSLIGSSLFRENTTLAHRDSHYYHLQVEDYIASHVPATDRIVLTGHSLGGTIAQIVAARRRATALAFASPGIGLLYRKFGIARDAIDAYTSNIVVSNDVIPLVDRMSGTVYHIQCEHSRGQICHSIELQTIRMWSMCPQYRESVYVNGSYRIIPLPYQETVNKVVDVLKSAAGL